MLQEGMQAPAFTLADKGENMVSLSDFSGKKVVLYFYPKDNTPGCTRQACAFASAYAEFERKNSVVIGISKDSISSHFKFTEKYNLPFVLLSDPELQAIQAYGVWQEKSCTERRAWASSARRSSLTNREKSSKSCPKSSRIRMRQRYWHCYSFKRRKTVNTRL